MEDVKVLQVENVNKSFPGTKALTDVSFDLKKGEILALVGENGAGKSTMMNIISGVLKRDSGKIMLFGKEVFHISPKEAQNAGIGFVHQELATCADLTVSENVFMGRLGEFKNKIGLVDYKRLNEETKKYLDKFGSKIKPTERVGDLKVADQQVIEIIKSISLDSKIIIFDEPTSSLTKTESKTLFEMIRNLKIKGISILYISHRMEEIFRLCDRIIILRDGELIDTLNTKDTNTEEVVRNMVGRTITSFYPNKSEEIGNVIFEGQGLSCEGIFKNISFQLHKGEILGFSGLVGAGRTELMRALCGIYKLSSGTIKLHGKKIKIDNYAESIKQGIVYLTEDRKSQGLFLKMSVMKNITVANIKKILTGILTNNKLEEKYANDYTDQLNIKISNVNQEVNSLSGGNQQKLMIAKWLFTSPKIFILDEPTRGIDVGAKLEIHTMLRNLANQGIGIIVISSELPEILGMSDRVIVMHEGKITGEVDRSDMCEEKIITFASSI